MRIHKESKAASPKVSLILLDWSVRESFHICHYLRNQTVPRDQFEVIVLEYYSTLSPALLQFEADFDTIAALEMPKSSYYHKHLMYNIGFLLSKGDIIVICDSDAMAKPTFIESIIKEFEKDPNIILHIDQFRNNRKDMYPFNYPSFEDIIGEGCINWADGVTTGIAATSDVLHRRNYGACFCCKRKDYIAIGGADEHIDYVGHICGPYELTFRLSNLGRKELWHRKEFLYHTWHPGSDGINNYLGPHDGRNVSSTALDHVATGRTFPHVTNFLIKDLQNGKLVSINDVCKHGIAKDNLFITSLNFLNNKESVEDIAKKTYRDTAKDIHLFYDQISKPAASESKKLGPQKNTFIIRPNIFSLLIMKLSLFLYCLKTSNKSIHTTPSSKSQNKLLSALFRLFFKALKTLFCNPKRFAAKWNHLIARYKYQQSLLTKFPTYFEIFQESSNNPQKTIIFAGNDLQVEFLQGLIATIELGEKSDGTNTLSSLIQVKPLSIYKKDQEDINNVKHYFTKCAFNQLHNKNTISHPY